MQPHICDVTKTYPDAVHALKGVTLTIPPSSGCSWRTGAPPSGTWLDGRTSSPGATPRSPAGRLSLDRTGWARAVDRAPATGTAAPAGAAIAYPVFPL